MTPFLQDPPNAGFDNIENVDNVDIIGGTDGIDRVDNGLSHPSPQPVNQQPKQLAPVNPNSSKLTPSSQGSKQIHDLICVGFGPASLAIAAALHDALDDDRNIAGKIPDVCFLERQSDFAWHAGMLLPGSKMQISFIKDLATLRDPRSEFTFLNYLRRHNRLVQFSNLGTFLPSRAEFQDYMKWCADHFAEQVHYDQEVVEIRPACVELDSRTDAFTVTSRSAQDGGISKRIARNVLIAIGGVPSIPSNIPHHHPRLIHSSQYRRKIHGLLPDEHRPYRIAVLGSGQSAAEMFQDLHQRYPNATTLLIIRDTALRPSDDSPFVNEVFDPARVDHFYCHSETVRLGMLRADRGTNYSVVRMELLEQIYHDLYQQRIHQPDEQQWQHRLLTSREIKNVSSANAQGDEKLILTMKNLDPIQKAGPTISCEEQQQKLQDRPQGEIEVLEVDALLLATGYCRNGHESLLEPLQHLRPAITTQGGPNDTNRQTTWQVRRDYKVVMDDSKVHPDAGIWLQGCNESTHGLADTLLSTLAVRGGEIVQSIFGAKQQQASS